MGCLHRCVCGLAHCSLLVLEIAEKGHVLKPSHGPSVLRFPPSLCCEI